MYAIYEGCQFVYDLATPITYTLTPGQVLSLLGQNNVWADTGDILSLTYNSKRGMDLFRQDTAGQINTVVDPVKTELDSAEAAMAIVVDGDTAPKNITKGQYVFVKNHSTLATGMYHATAASASGASVTSSNVEADEEGGINALVEDYLTTKAIANFYTDVSSNATISGVNECWKTGNVVYLLMTIYPSADESTLIACNLISEIRPFKTLYGYAMNDTDKTVISFSLNADGTVRLYGVQSGKTYFFSITYLV